VTNASTVRQTLDAMVVQSAMSVPQEHRRAADSAKLVKMKLAAEKGARRVAEFAEGKTAQG